MFPERATAKAEAQKLLEEKGQVFHPNPKGEHRYKGEILALTETHTIQRFSAQTIYIHALKDFPGKITPLAPKGSYWFKFISETEAKGGTVLNQMTVYLTTPPFFVINTKIGDEENGDAALFYRIIKTLESYTWEKNELKFFYDNKQHYLLYKYSKP